MKKNIFLIDEAIEHYCELHTTSEDEALRNLSRETNLTMLMPRMLSGVVQGQFLTMLVEIIKPKNILELGTFTGYSAICLAKGLAEDGKLITIDKNPEIETIARKYFKISGLEDKITLLIGDAFEIVSKSDQTFDMVFLDADKERLPDYYQLIMPKIPSGGMLVADNILWDGKVIDPAQNDRVTEKIREFNNIVQSDEQVENVLLPLRDGVMMIRKK